MNRLFDSLLEPTFILDSGKRIVYCNEPAALLADVSVRKLMRQQPVFDELFLFEDPIEGLRDLPSIADATPYQEVRFRTEAGKDGKVQVTFQPFEATDGTTSSWLVFFRDVTLEETLQKKYRAELEQKEGYIRELEDARAKLEDYSKNLEVKVAERTAELSRLNQLMGALLDSLGQGFFVFDQEGKVLEIASKACQATVEKDPRGLFIWEALGLQEREVPGLKKWMTTLFAEMLPFEDLAPLGPPRYPHSQGSEIQLEYYPLRTEQGGMEGVVVVATDITSLVQAQREAEHERSYARMILQLLKNRRQVAGFIRESEDLLRELARELASPTPSDEATFRVLHTLKGGAASFSIRAIAEHCHAAENLLSEWKSFRDEERLARLRGHCTEIPGLFAQFMKENEVVLGRVEEMNERIVETPVSSILNFADRFLESRESAPLREALFRHFLFEEVGPLFEHFNEVTQNVAERLGKQVAPLRIQNPEFRLLPEPYEPLFATLVHAFRNAVDHGIETPEVRERAGKPAQGNLTLHFERREARLHVRLEDDGAGIDPARIREKLAKSGFDCARESDEDVIQHIFDSQFSTRETVTEVSGRGVGMDAIAQSARSLGGNVRVTSTPGRGTTLSLDLPWIDSWSAARRQAA